MYSPTLVLLPIGYKHTALFKTLVAAIRQYSAIALLVTLYTTVMASNTVIANDQQPREYGQASVVSNLSTILMRCTNNAMTFVTTCFVLAHRDSIKAIAVSPDGNWLVTAAPNNRVTLWQQGEGDHYRKPKYLFKAESQIIAMA